MNDMSVCGEVRSEEKAEIVKVVVKEKLEGKVPGDKDKTENFCLVKNNSTPSIITAHYHGGPVLHAQSHGSYFGVDGKFCSRTVNPLAAFEAAMFNLDARKVSRVRKIPSIDAG